MVKSFESWFEMPTGEYLLIGGGILAVLILLFIAGTAAETFRKVSGELKDAALPLGVPHLYATRRVIVRQALPFNSLRPFPGRPGGGRVIGKPATHFLLI
jgi:ABC-type phosphate transport system permease subunit